MENKVWELLKEVRFPGMSRDIVSFGFVDKVEADGDRVVVDLAIATHNRASADQVRDDVEALLQEATGGYRDRGQPTDGCSTRSRPAECHAG